MFGQSVLGRKDLSPLTTTATLVPMEPQPPMHHEEREQNIDAPYAPQPLLGVSNAPRAIVSDVMDEEEQEFEFHSDGQRRRIRNRRDSNSQATEMNDFHHQALFAAQLTLTQLSDLKRFFETRFRHLRDTSVLYTVAPVRSSTLEAANPKWRFLHRMALFLRLCLVVFDIILHFYALKLLSDQKSYIWLSIGGSIIGIRTIINILVARGVAQTSFFYHILVILQMNFIYEGYLSFKIGEHTALYQVAKFVQAALEGLPFTLVLASQILLEKEAEYFAIISMAVSILSGSLNAWEVSCRDAPSFNHGPRRWLALFYRFSEIMAHISCACLFTYYFQSLIILIFFFKWLTMSFVSLSRHQERNSETAFSVVYGLSLLDVVIIFTSAMLPGSRRPRRDAEYFMVADSSAWSFFQALMAADFVDAVMVVLMLIAPEQTIFDSPSLEVKYAFWILIASHAMHHIFFLLLAFSARRVSSMGSNAN